MTPRTFVVTVSEAPARVVVEDVRTRRRSVAGDLGEVGTQIASWLVAGEPDDPSPPAGDRVEDP